MQPRRRLSVKTGQVKGELVPGAIRAGLPRSADWPAWPPQAFARDTVEIRATESQREGNAGPAPVALVVHARYLAPRLYLDHDRLFELARRWG